MASGDMSPGMRHRTKQWEAEQAQQIEAALAADPTAQAPESKSSSGGETETAELIELSEAQAEKLEELAKSQLTEVDVIKELIVVMENILTELRSVSAMVREMT